MAAMDRDVRVGCFVLAFGLFICGVSFTMPSRGGLAESPGIFPGLMGLLLLVFGSILTLRSLKKGGRIRLAHFFKAIIPIMNSAEHRPVILGIILPAIYIIVGIPLIGFYPSSVLFLAIMFYCFVKRWRRWYLFIPIAVGFTFLLYLTFTVLFMLQIK